MPLVANKVSVRQHPGSSQHDIDNEPEWGAGHQHRVGYRNRQDRRPGITHAGDEREDDAAFRKRALQELQQLHDEIDHGKLINFRDAVTQQEVCPIWFALVPSMSYFASSTARLPIVIA